MPPRQKPKSDYRTLGFTNRELASAAKKVQVALDRLSQEQEDKTRFTRQRFDALEDALAVLCEVYHDSQKVKQEKEPCQSSPTNHPTPTDPTTSKS